MINLSAWRGIIFCLCAPAGSGKSTLAREIVSRVPALSLSISTTSRTPREGEQNGVHYHFISREEFKRRIDAGNFIEWAEFAGNLYGTERSNLEGVLRGTGHDLLLTIEVQGVTQLKALFAAQVVTLFVFPPSFAELERRLRARGTDSEETIMRRLHEAEREVVHLGNPGFADYYIENDTIERALVRIETVIRAERLRLARLVSN